MIVVRTGETARTLRPGRIYRMGRDPHSDIAVAHPTVSWLHAILRVDGSQWLLEDADSSNGTFIGASRVRRAAITGSCEIRLGEGPSCWVMVLDHRPPPGASGSGGQGSGGARPLPAAPAGLTPTAPAGRSPSTVMQLTGRTLRIGRDASNDIVADDLSVSRRHAELRKAGDYYEIVDLGSFNGTFVNGQQVIAAPVTGQDVVGIGRASYRLVGDQLQEFTDTGDITLHARQLSVRLPGGKVILDDVSFPLGERTLMAVIGPSGAGKSTLLGALTGMQPATSGGVTYDGRDLYANYAELRDRIGLVPQENILHTQLSPRRALGYAAELRFPRDVSADDRNRRVTEVLGELALTEHAETRTVALSGGQQKRVNVALELLTKPSLLFLDEPTSGLDPGLDMAVMEMLAGLAHDGRTVIVVTHSVANLDVCDRLLVLVPGGKVAFFGPPADGLAHFGQPGWAQVFRALDAEPGRDWPAQYRASPYCARYVTSDMKRAPAVSTARTPAVPAVPGVPVPPPRPRRRLAQLSTLARRYLAVIASDRTFVGAIALLPVILGALVRLIPDDGGLTGRGNPDANQVLLILTMGACLTGVASSVRELVKERPLYTRERAAGLSPSAYLGSKLAVLGAISAIQAVVLVLIGVAGRPLPPHGAVLAGLPLLEIVLAMAALAAASMAAGLLISALVSSSDKTMPLLVVVVLVQVVLSGAVFRLNHKAGLNQASWLSPSRWGLGAAGSTVDLNQVAPMPRGGTADPLWRHTARQWATDMAGELVLGAVFASLTWWRLTRTRPGRRG
jgi:ABC-type multidrug transport system ATPase subunit/pSer/pThr/pTyr-binding forkhead associated (FHA) protein